MTVETQQVQVNGLSFRCRLDGPEGAPWLVFSNSLLTDLTLWDDQVAAFGDRYRILRYDQRGHGGTEVPPGPATIDQLTGDLEALLDHFGIQRLIMAGVSMGAATALNLAGRRPGSVVAVIASDGQAATAPGGAQAWQERMDMARAEGMEAYTEITLKRWFSPVSLAAGNAAISKMRAIIGNTPEAGFIACATALQAYDVRAALPGLPMPVLLIAGAADGAMPVSMRKLCDVIPDARFVEIPDAGHLPGVEAPGPFNLAMGEFLAGLKVTGLREG